jgi:hypothetical protein
MIDEIDRFLADMRRGDLIRALARPGLSDDEIAVIEHRYDVQTDEVDVPVEGRLQ